MKQPSDERHVIELEGPHGRELLIQRRDVSITLRRHDTVLASAGPVRPRTGS